jgi:hypothetical protein
MAQEGSTLGRGTPPPMTSIGTTTTSLRNNKDPFSDKNAIGSNKSNTSNNLSPTTYKTSNAYNIVNRSNTTATTSTNASNNTSNQSNFASTLRPGRRALLSIASFGNRGSLPASRRNSLTGIGIGAEGSSSNNYNNSNSSNTSGPGALERNRQYDPNGNRTNVKVPYLDLDKNKPYTTYTKRPNRI